MDLLLLLSWRKVISIFQNVPPSADVLHHARLYDTILATGRNEQHGRFIQPTAQERSRALALLLDQALLITRDGAIMADTTFAISAHTTKASTNQGATNSPLSYKHSTNGQLK
jgi:hypothetical protein